QLSRNGALSMKTPRRYLSLFFAAIVLASSVLLAQEKEADLADLIERAEPSCVRIDVNLKDGSRSIGSGFVVDAERRWVVTNYHVVADSNEASVVFADKSKAKVEGWRAHYTDKDLALLQIETSKQLVALPVAAALPRKGEKTFAIGTPAGLSFTVTEGIVSAIRDGDELNEYSEFGQSKDPELQKFKYKGSWLQTSTPISPGSSGGPLLNLKGEVIGINSGSLASGQNINFAVSCMEIQRLVEVGKRIRLRELSLLTPTPGGKGIKTERGSADGNGGKTITVRLPAKRRFRHTLDIEKTEDEFDQISILRTPWLPLKYDDPNLSSLGLRVSIVFDETEVMPLALWEIGITANGFQTLGPGNARFQILSGDDSWELPQGRAERNVANGGTSEILRAVTGIDVFVKIILEDKVKARLGRTQMEFERSHLESLRDLASQIPTGDFFDGKLHIEHLDRKDDPTAGGR
ncbi:MAG: trypsin-like peptidase domain-containing protein, partial [Planctomycetaceae bacterium]|nr:trypsin-like peptidase domain-containing protein [Planctomycetaceae bacterium]